MARSNPLKSQLIRQGISTRDQFDQLAELRNGIRHSRAVTDITRKEGEAAILWFNQLLLKEKSA